MESEVGARKISGIPAFQINPSDGIIISAWMFHKAEMWTTEVRNTNLGDADDIEPKFNPPCQLPFSLIGFGSPWPEVVFTSPVMTKM